MAQTTRKRLPTPFHMPVGLAPPGTRRAAACLNLMTATCERIALVTLSTRSMEQDMSAYAQAQEVRGKTMQWTWTEGPTHGATHEHVFHDDGTVEWRAVGGAAQQQNRAPKASGAKGTSQVRCHGRPQTGLSLCPISRRSRDIRSPSFSISTTRKWSGSPLGARDWYPVQGTFRVIN